MDATTMTTERLKALAASAKAAKVSATDEAKAAHEYWKSTVGARKAAENAARIISVLRYEGKATAAKAIKAIVNSAGKNGLPLTESSFHPLCLTQDECRIVCLSIGKFLPSVRWAFDDLLPLSIVSNEKAA